MIVKRLEKFEVTSSNSMASVRGVAHFRPTTLSILASRSIMPNDRLVDATKKSPPFIWTEFGDAIPFEEYEDFAARLRRARDDTLEEVIELNSKEDVRAFVKNLN